MSESLIMIVQSIAEPVSWFLVHSLWLGAVIAIVLAGAQSVLRRHSPQVRYVVAIAALLLITPVSISMVTYHMLTHNSAGGSTAMDYGQTSTVPHAHGQSTAAADTETGFFSSLPEIGVSKYTSASFWIFLLWLVGISVVSLYHLLGWRRARHLLHIGSSPVPTEWQRRFEEIRRRTGIAWSVKLLKSTTVKVPCVVGWIKPTILIPLSAFSGLGVAELEMILAHELAHVRRHDVLINYLQTTIETLLFFNPFVWWISRQIRTEREHCCDDLAVGFCGDRLGYARALANLEDLCHVRPHLASAVDGTSLVKRIHRLTGSTRQARRWPGFGAMSAFSLVAILALSLSLFAAFNPSDVTAQVEVNVKYQEEPDDLHGRWGIEPSRYGLHLTMIFGSRGRSGFTLHPEDLVGLSEGMDVVFKLERDAGTFFFEGEIEIDGDNYYGEGECHFRSNPDYTDEMRDLGYRVRSTREAFRLALHDVNLEFAQGISDAGYDGLSLERLVEMHIHQVTPEFINGLNKLGYRDLSVDKLVEMRIHRATVEYIEELHELGYSNLDPDEIVEMRIHRVDTEYIREFSDLGMRHLSPSKLVEMSIHRVTPSYVRELSELGYKNLRPDKLVEMSIHRVDPGYIRELAEIGLDDIDPSKLIEMRIHRVEPSYVRKLKGLGYDRVDPNDLVAMSIHNVTISFIEDLIERGYDDLSPDELVEFRIHGIERMSRWRRDSD
ncbi:MAG: M56 family metallopeptidase [Candidatus Zixiibacteriota bacterium]|nr:MAG: M56 family metallopeptidase [candidate division Zixibacteria bacterium]